MISEKAKVIEQYDVDDEIVFKASDDKRANFYFINKKSHTLDKIVNATKTKEKVEVLFTEIIGEVAIKIQISHHQIKLEIELEKFVKE